MLRMLSFSPTGKYFLVHEWTTNDHIWMNRFVSAAAYSQMGEHDKAIEDANAALKLDETYSKAYSRLG